MAERRALRILLSAYACEPQRGSEPGVGWRWAIETARLGHEVWVLTRANNRCAIDAALADTGLPLHMIYHDLPRWAAWWKRGGRGVHLYYLLWQWTAWRKLRRSAAGAPPWDVVHHITFGVLRQPSFLGRLGLPLVVGPVGGAERAPPALRRHFSWRGRTTDALRDVANRLARHDPWVRSMYRSAALVLAKTPESLAWLPASCRPRAACLLEIGIDVVGSTTRTGRAAPGSAPAAVMQPAPAAALPSAHAVDPVAPVDPVDPARVGRLRLLYVGRFLALKGLGLGLRALARLQARGIDATLTLVGHGPEESRWRALALRLGISAHLRWVPWVSQAELATLYASHDALLFPSLRDASGNVVLEAMAQGLPVVCLQLGGPACMVDASCGRVVPVAGCGEDAVVAGLAQALESLAVDAVLLERLRAGARAQAQARSWAAVVGRVWGPAGLGWRALARQADGAVVTLAKGEA